MAPGLLQLRRSLYAPLPDVKLPAGVSIRTFEIGRDEDAWLEVNSSVAKGLQGLTAGDDIIVITWFHRRA